MEITEYRIDVRPQVDLEDRRDQLVRTRRRRELPGVGRERGPRRLSGEPATTRCRVREDHHGPGSPDLPVDGIGAFLADLRQGGTGPAPPGHGRRGPGAGGGRGSTAGLGAGASSSRTTIKDSDHADRPLPADRRVSGE